MKRTLIAAAVLGLLGASCGSVDTVATSTSSTTLPGPDLGAQLAALATARQLWEGAPDDYTIAVGDQTLAIRGDEVVSLASAEAPTVHDVYSTIEESIRTGANVEVEYDPELGYPTRVVIDLDDDGIPDVDLTLDEFEEMPVVENLDQILRSRELWKSQGFDDYRYIFRAECTCPEGGTFDVDVRDGRLVRFVPLDETAATSSLTPTTMREAFDDLEEWFTDSAELIDQGVLDVDVRMDPEFGYPRWFHVAGAAIDDEQLADPFTIVVTIDLVLPYSPIDEVPPAGVSAQDQKALEVAQAVWAEVALENYRYQLTFHCECPLATSGPFEITVRGGELWSTVGPLGGGGPLPDKVMIEDFFDVIAITVAAGTDVDITYDADYGFPALAIIDTEAVAVDGGLAFSVTEFEPIDRLGFLTGTVLAGPQCPVQQDPPQPECEDQPVANVEIVITSDESGEVATTVVTSIEGGFSFALEPGMYLITAPDLGEYRGTPDPVSVTISAGATEEVILTYDTGIR